MNKTTWFSELRDRGLAVLLKGPRILVSLFYLLHSEQCGSKDDLTRIFQI